MNPCEVHRSHRPGIHRTVLHHRWPRGMGGPDTADNKVWVCDSGHVSIHVLIAALIAANGGQVANLRSWHPEERRLARAGYDQWVAAGKPGRPEYALTENGSLT